MSQIQLKFYEPTHHDELVNYTLPEDQINFTALPAQTFERLKARTDNNAKPITILLDDKPIGFFVLDYDEDKYDFTENENSLLLRSLSINPAFQGNSYGKIAMNLVDDFVKTYYPTIDELVLAVNFKNTSAYQLYIKVGYIDNGSQREWNNGMQHLLRKNLK
ncbi:GNAT family N-acetyltransferase [Algoriella sp.]|uniref:GNAT family N-acetyltransferase n=1 Tax=Algoriella sp. TaxID=1872434 RepID=UPI001B26D4F4|nr:GNAT family N-acetyltransferase [Algoriella sp.]MBO6211866.1 GNAT family N-acetyltransferase [Algoriella sp.]